MRRWDGGTGGLYNIYVAGMPTAGEVWGVTLRSWRVRRGLSQSQVADWLGVSRSTLSRWETGLVRCEYPVMLRGALAHWDCSNDEAIVG